jgi:hypothetical protein
MLRASSIDVFGVRLGGVVLNPDNKKTRVREGAGLVALIVCLLSDRVLVDAERARASITASVWTETTTGALAATRARQHGF